MSSVEIVVYNGTTRHSIEYETEDWTEPGGTHRPFTPIPDLLAQAIRTICRSLDIEKP